MKNAPVLYMDKREALLFNLIKEYEENPNSTDRFNVLKGHVNDLALS